MSNQVCKSGNRLNSWFGDFEDVFQTFFDSPKNKVAFQPRWDVVESGDSFQVQVELPGLSEEDVNVEFEDGVLSISGEKKVEHAEEGKLHRRERFSGSFKRTLEFNVPVELDQIEASFTNGILEVNVPKSEKALPRKIDIQVKK